MNRLLAVCLFSLSTLAAAGPQNISVEFRGSLRDGLREIASKGGLNLVATGELSEPAEVYLKDVSAEAALETVATAYHLKIFRQGSIWTLRPMTEDEVKAAEAAAASAARAAPTPEPRAASAPSAASPSAPGSAAPTTSASAPLAPGSAAPTASAFAPLAPGSAAPTSAPQVPGSAAPTASVAALPVPGSAASTASASAPLAPGSAAPDSAAPTAGASAASAAPANAFAPVPPTPPTPPTPPGDRASLSERETRSKILSKLKIKRSNHDGNDLVSTGPVEVDEGQVVDSAVSYGSSVTVKSGGVVQEDVVSFGGDVVLEPGAVVEGDAVAFGGKVDKDDGAVVEGDVVSFGGLGAAVAKGVTITAKHGSEAREDRPARPDHLGIGLTGFLMRFAVLFGLGFLFVMFAPLRMKAIEGELRRAPMMCGLTGLIGAVALAVLSVMLVITLVGIPAALALWMVVGVGVAMGIAAIASYLGLRLPVLRTKKSQAVVLAAGLLVMMVAAKIPVLGPISMGLVILLALGAIIRTRFGQVQKGMPQPDTAI